MKIRSAGSRGVSATSFRSPPATPVLACLALGFFACSASDPAPVGGSTNNAQNMPESPSPSEPAATLPPGVMMTVDETGQPVYVDMEGNPVDPATIPTVTEMPGTVPPGAPVDAPVNPPSTSPASPEDDPAIILTPEPEDVLTDSPTPVAMDGDLVDGMVCNSAEVMFQPVIPTVMLLIDRSTSMFASSLPDGGSPAVGMYPDRWEALRAAVDLLEPFSSEIQFGAMTYTGYNPDRVALDACPEIQGADIAVATDNFAQIQALLPPSAEAIPGAKSETPTAEGVAAATEVLAAVPSDGPKYIVLVTDGLPEMCGVFDRGPYCGSDPTIGAVQAAYALGIQTYVIGIGFENAPGDEAPAAEYLLNGLAHAGQGLEVPPVAALDQFKPCLQLEAPMRGTTLPDDFWNEENWRTVAAGTYGAAGSDFTGTLYLQPGDTQLGEQLSQVVAGVRSCSFEMEQSVYRDQANKGAVRLTMVDGTTSDLVYDDPNGWALDPTLDNVVVIQGTACAQVQDADQVEAVRIEFPCEVRVPEAR